MSEMDKLEKYLKENGYKYTREDKDFINHGYWVELDTHQICVFDRKGNFIFDAICHSGSYGYRKGLLEIRGDIVTEEDGDSVVGMLTAEDVIERIKKHKAWFFDR